MGERPRGVCPACERDVALKNDGSCVIHRVGPPLRRFDCRGSGLAPHDPHADAHFAYPPAPTSERPS